MIARWLAFLLIGSAASAEPAGPLAPVVAKPAQTLKPDDPYPRAHGHRLQANAR